MNKSLEGKMTTPEAIFHVVVHVGAFVGGVFAYRYINMLFDHIHRDKEQALLESRKEDNYAG